MEMKLTTPDDVKNKQIERLLDILELALLQQYNMFLGGHEKLKNKVLSQEDDDFKNSFESNFTRLEAAIKKNRPLLTPSPS